MRIFVDVLISFDAMAFLILAITTLPVPPCLSTTIPRLTKWLRFSDLVIIHCNKLEVVMIFMSSVFLMFTLSPTPADVVAKRVVLSCVWLQLYWRSARLSAKSRSSSWSTSVYFILFFLPFVVVVMIQSFTRRKKKGVSKHPCRVAVSTVKLPKSWPACLQFLPENVHWISRMILLGTP